MFDFGNANKEQRKAIQAANGPVLITAGPGTGKTYTLVQRTIYLIEECGIEPESIFIATFTEKAAKELITRITNELAVRNIIANVNEMYVGTFHALCLRILKEHLEYTRLRRNYRLLDAFDQQYMVFQNIYRFKDIPEIDNILPKSGSWKQAEAICNYVNNLSEEMVSPDKLLQDSEPSIIALGQILKKYRQILAEGNLMDFSSIQIEAYELLRDHPEVLKELHSQISHIMVDEYQDTNFIQERIIFLLAGRKKNICVVGDDDQGLYRFRGATIRNILEFPNKFPDNECQIIPLVVNYRSNSDIVAFYNEWMNTTAGSKFKFEWGKYRYGKKIVPYEKSVLNSSSVVKLTSVNDVDEWHEKILEFIKSLEQSGKLTNYNQIAFLFSSVKHPRVINLAKFLEANHISVYSPRSDMFFQRDEVRLTIGCLMLLFPMYIKGLENGEYIHLQPEHITYYVNCIKFANGYLKKTEYANLKKWIRRMGKDHITLTGTTDYAYCGLLYQMFQFQPFATMLDTDMDAGLVDIRPSRNLAKLTQIIGKFEYLHRVDVLDGTKYKGRRRIDANTELLFNLYLRLLMDGGITEYEDDSEYAPSGCVSFLTIHQVKGMEFPIVIVDSLSNVPRKNFNELMVKVEERYFHRPAFEPYETTKYFDFWRLYYTAFSRAQDLLILTCNEDKRTPSKYFKDIYKELSPINSSDFNLQEFDFKPIKDVNIKNTYSFTSNITVYETCARQYKFYKELEFMPVHANAMLFGTLVHETIEDIHKAALRHEEETITDENISKWFNSNYVSLTQTEHSYLSVPQKAAALKQVLHYVDRQGGDWSKVQQAEVEVSLVKPDYIIGGKIDLIRGEGNTVEIVDFKSERKPDMIKMRERLEQYRRQLNIYAYLVEQRTGQKVSKMHLYYTAEEDGVPTITYPYQKTAIEGTMAAFDDTVHKIMKKDFHKCSDNPKICKNCDFRYYCMNK
ncbi:ATP-dependent helicase [Megasphaera elsdenii]|uniref:ATP-dependent helicase n=1 Tax=Megasphaera elsdenii TaxID=907 RepID=UPI000512AE62|nr:ATP-dependent DNA helicase [Megasphaera elsdenii]KGI88468.1 DNA helicase UvrD [Megasphaera elsdenii]